MNRPLVLLVNPPLVNGLSFTRESRCQEREELLATVKPPLTIAYLAAVLNEVAELEVVDATINRWHTHQLIEYLHRNKIKPDLVIFPTTTPTLKADFKAMQMVKKYSAAFLFAFGPQVTAQPKDVMRLFPAIDGVILGEPEDATKEIVEIYQTAPTKKSFFSKYLKLVEGVAYRNKNKIYLSPARKKRVDINKLPFPAWDKLPWKKYRLPLYERNYFLVEVSRGCPFGCEFCVVSYLAHGFKYRQRRVDKVIEEIKYLQKRFKVDTFNLWADTFTFDQQFLNQFSDEIKKNKLKISWFANSRIDTIRNYNEARKLKNSGCIMLSFGIESPDKKTLEKMNKHSNINITPKILYWIKKAGIKTFGFFIYGYPGETVETMRQTTSFALSLPLDFASFYPAVPIPGTPFYNECRRNKLLVTEDWDKMEYSYYILNDGELNQDTVMKERGRAYRSFYLRPKIIWGIMKEIHSPLGMVKVMRKGINLLNWVK